MVVSRTRRSVLLMIGVVGSVTLAGCMGNSGDNTQDDSPPELSFFEEFLGDEDIDVVDLGVDKSTVELQYATEKTSDQALGAEIGTIAAGYVLAIDRGLETDELNATIINADNETAVAEWFVQTEWAVAFDDGEMTADQFNTEVLNTVEMIGNESDT